MPRHWVYHPTEEPRIVEDDEAQAEALANGWFDHPDCGAAPAPAPAEAEGPAEDLMDAIATLNSTDNTLYTGTGRPKLAVLEELIGREISAAERDEAWGAFITSPPD